MYMWRLNLPHTSLVHKHGFVISSNLTQGSAHDLHGRMGEELPDDRWRPNIVVEGAEAWGEDLWERFTISSPSHGTAIEMASVRPCDRCKVFFPWLEKPVAAVSVHIAFIR